MPRILVGRIGAPHGVRGEMRLQSFTQDPTAIAGYGPLATAEGRGVTLTRWRRLKDDMLVVTVAGIGDRSAAGQLTGTELFVERERLPAPDTDEFYVADLIGLEAVDVDGAAIGKIIAVPNYGGGDILEVRPPGGGETLMFPFTREVVPTIDVAARRVVIVPPAELAAGDASDLAAEA